MTQRVAFISGSGRNIGRAIALELAKSGCSVIINGSRDHAAGAAVVEEVKALGVDAIYVAGSVGNADDVRRMAGEALEHFKAVNIVVNNASIRPQTPFANLTEDEWHHVIGLSLIPI